MGLIGYIKRKKGLICPLCNSTSFTDYKKKHKRDISIAENLGDTALTVAFYFKGYKKTNLLMCKSCNDLFVICPYCKNKISRELIFNDDIRLPIRKLHECENCCSNMVINIFK